MSNQEPMACPWRPCAAMALPLPTRSDPYDASVITIVYPIHDVIGPASWFGRCPASQLIVSPGLTPAGVAVLAAADEQYVRMLAERIARQPEHAHDELVGVSDETVSQLIGGKTLKTPPDVADYFPGRPADAPEPGIGDEPAAPVPANVGGGQLGKAKDMSTRDQHIALVNVAIERAGEIQELTASVTDALTRIDAYVEAMARKQQAGAALMIGAVGAGGSLPLDAERALTGYSRVGELLSELRTSAALLRIRNESVGRISGATAAAATIYRAGL
jgi:hypothetical protein